jgi:hypothetical protein
LLKSAEEMLKRTPTITDLQNQATVSKTEVQAIQSELAETKRKQALDHASLAEEKDGRLNERYYLIFPCFSLYKFTIAKPM